MKAGHVVARHAYGITHASVLGLTYCGIGVGPHWVTFNSDQFDCRRCLASERRGDSNKPLRGKWAELSRITARADARLKAAADRATLKEKQP